MSSKYDFLNITESDNILNTGNENINQTFNEPYIPLQTEAYLGVRTIKFYNNFSL